MYSIIIPAHNEAPVISRTLAKLTKSLDFDKAEVIVVCNGCKDDTAAQASRFKGVKVISIEEASKPAALNEGDRIATGFPRAYMDADIDVDGAELCRAMSEAGRDGVEIVCPSSFYDCSQSSIFVKSFYAVWTALPHKMVGAGIYIISEQGRGRFGEFPKITSDDGYARENFNEEEQRTSKQCPTRIYAPRTLGDLIKIKTRARFGNMELNKKYPKFKAGGENGAKAIVSYVLGRPWMIFAACLYVWIQLQTKKHARKRMENQDFGTWERDESSRC